MFSNMKNKIREKTGSDLPKISVNQKSGIGRHSRQGSETSLSSLDHQTKDDLSPLPLSSNEIILADGKSLTPKEMSKLSKREDEWRNRLEKKEGEWMKKLEKRESELNKLLEDREFEWRKKEQKMTEELLKLTVELKDSLRVAEESKRKLCQYQEDKDQLEGFQMQEISKLKHLFLAKEEENSKNAAALKEASTTISSLRAEVKRLRPFEEQVSDFQTAAKGDNMELAGRVVEAESRCASLQEQLATLRTELETERSKPLPDDVVENIAQLNARLDRQLYELQEERQKHEELSALYEKEKRDKDEVMMRNAQVSQEVEIARQELRSYQRDADDVYLKKTNLETMLKDKSEECERIQNENSSLKAKIVDLQNGALDNKVEKELRTKLVDLETQLSDRNKNIRVLQQRLTDMKKTLQRELKGADPGGGGGGGGTKGVGELTNHVPLVPPVPNTPTSSPSLEDDVNFKYLKHVLIKFLTCRDYEAQHLTRAVATLLRFSQEEERLLRETLEWRKSWFGARPRLKNSPS